MRFHFNECPDCGEEYSKVGNTPELDRRLSIDCDGTLVANNVVKAVCNKCYWETKYHSNVGGCVEEWNNTDLYSNTVYNNESAKYCNECACYIEGEDVCSRGILANAFEPTCSQFVANQ